MTEIFRYKSGPDNMIVLRHTNGHLTRNGSLIHYNKNGRKYIEVYYNRTS